MAQRLTREQDPVKVEVGRLHKLRILLRNETISWVDSFIELDGLSQIAGLLHRIMGLEWREDHEDQLLHETLLCLKGLCTTDKALDELCKFADNLLPALLGMLFDEERKGPAEYTTRAVVITSLMSVWHDSTSSWHNSMSVGHNSMSVRLSLVNGRREYRSVKTQSRREKKNSTRASKSSV